MIPPICLSALDLVGLKARPHSASLSRNLATVGSTSQTVGEELCEALDLRAGQRLLDITVGNGNFSLAAARRGCDVTSAYSAPDLLARSEVRAEAGDLTIVFREADVDALPFASESFDVVASAYGVILTSNQDKAVAEMLRVCRPGGKIGLAHWTPQSIVGQAFKIFDQYLPPQIGAKLPARWGTHARLAELFGGSAASINTEAYDLRFCYRSPAHFAEVFSTYYGPALKPLAALDDDKRELLFVDLQALIHRLNRADNGTREASGEFLQAVIVKR